MNELNAKTEALPTPVEVPGRIGYINYAPSMNYSNCKMEFFESATEANNYFEANRDRLCVTIVPGHNGTLFALVAKSLTDDELQELNEIASIVEEERAKRRAVREEAEAAAQEEMEANAKRERELMQLGRKCAEHHAPLIDEVRKLKDEVKKLRKGKS